MVPFVVSLSKDLISVSLKFLAWTIIVLSALMLPISAISLLMILARSYGTTSTTLIGFLGIVVLPPAIIVVGIGLLFHRAWAWYGVLLLCGLMGYNLWELFLASPQMTITTKADGTTTYAASAYGSERYNVPILAFCTLALATLFSRSVRSDCGIVR